MKKLLKNRKKFYLGLPISLGCLYRFILQHYAPLKRALRPPSWKREAQTSTHHMQFLRVFLITLLLFFSLHASFAQEAEKSTDPEQKTVDTEGDVELVSPIGAMVRSAVFPGWGQFYSRGYFRGCLTFLGVGGSAIGALLAQRSFNNRYNAYATYASLNPHDEAGVLERYDYANQRYKLRTFFMYTGIGIWVYSLIDAYVSSNFYNATTLVESIHQDAKDMEKLGIEIGATPSHLYFGIVKTF